MIYVVFMKERNLNVDALRILSCIFVIGIHATYNFNPNGLMDFNNYAGLFLHSIFRAGLPVFFIISGYYLLNSKITSIKSFYFKRLVNIIIPFLMYSLLHFVIMNRESTLSLNIYSDYFIKLVNGSLSVHFWFVYVIIGMYLFTPVFSSIINEVSDKTLNLSFISLLMAYFINMYSSNLTDINIKQFELPYLNHWYLYFFIGGYIGRKKFTMKKITAISFIVIGYILTVMSVYKTKNYHYLMPFDSGINMIILSTSIFLFFARTDFSFSRGGVLITEISKHTYGVYLIHMAILNVIYVYFMTSNILYNSLMMICTCLSISFVISYVTDNFLIKRITILSGVSRILSTPDRK